MFVHQTSLVSGGVGILGASKGGELAIATACHANRITALCTINGNISSIGGATTHKKSGAVYLPTPLDVKKVLIYDDDTINIRNTPGVPCPPELQTSLYSKFLTPDFKNPGTRIVHKDFENSDDKDDEDDIDDVQRDVYATSKNREEYEGRYQKNKKKLDPLELGLPKFGKMRPSMYPLESISTPWCLFIAGEEDQNWHSPLYALEAQRRIKSERIKNQKSYPTDDCE